MGMTCNLILDGISASSIGVTVEGYPDSAIPKRKITKISVPGRNGDLLIDEGSYENVKIPYTMHWKAENDAVVSAWLNKPGYRKISDELHADIYREGYITSSAVVSNVIDVLHRAKIEFSCKPQVYRVSGDTEIVAIKNAYIENLFDGSSPVITVTGTGAGTLTIAGSVVQIENIPDQGIIIDSENQNCYTPTLYENQNNNVSIVGGFPNLKHGENLITWSGGISSVKVKPRWWSLL